MAYSIDDLAAIQDISALRARYFRTLDGKDWPDFADVFTADATADGREGFAARLKAGGGWTVNGRPDLVASHLANLNIPGMLVAGGAQIAAKAETLFPAEIITVHHGHMAEITFDAADRARGIWAMEDRLLFPDGAPLKELHGFGHYHDTYRREDGRWKIAAFRLNRLRVDIR